MTTTTTTTSSAQEDLLGCRSRGLREAYLPNAGNTLALTGH
jgi:hypothetical protein